jgi:hypothetical protein
MSNFNRKSSKQLMIIVAVVLVLYLMTKSGYSEEEYYEEGDQSGYKSNAAFNIAPHVYVPPSAAQIAAASPILANANVAALTPAQAAALGKVAAKGVSEYSTNATVNRKAYAQMFTPPTAAQVAAAQTILANANVAALTPAQAAALGRVAPAPQASHYGYGMAQVKF